MKIPNITGVRILLVTIVVLIFIAYPYYKDYRELRDKQKTALVLKENENDKIVVRGRTVTHVKRVHLPDGTTRQKVTRKVGIRKVAVTVRKDGSVDVYAKRHGPTFEPGLSIGYGDGARIGLDAEFYYFKKWALGGGVDTDLATTRRFRFHAGIFRDLYIGSLDNTSLYFGIDHTTAFRINFRVRFGGGVE